ncbi:Ras-related protein Rab-43-like [Oopsacas minuta]|uniref:Ras-related protein Rab-43-like n=1 Tax=Oopsacas minuta TaxID=111878 RepID=A0AAV7JU42_9METZ|nr:Ras-related protein Rab-43-like [Oopsacas minuta]
MYRSQAPRSLYPISEDTGLASWTAQGQQINIQVRDTISATPTSINTTLCRNLDIVLCVYSLDRKSSVEEMGKWYQSIYKNISHESSVINCLVGNKCDLVPPEDGINDSIARIKPLIESKHNFKVSGTTGEGIPEMINEIGQDYINKRPRVKDRLPIDKPVGTKTDDAYCCIN